MDKSEIIFQATPSPLNHVLTTIFIIITVGGYFVGVNYFVLFNFDKGYQSFTDNSPLFLSPRIQLIILATNILLFRFMIVKWNREQTGRGLLLVIVIAFVFQLISKQKTLPEPE